MASSAVRASPISWGGSPKSHPPKTPIENTQIRSFVGIAHDVFMSVHHPAEPLIMELVILPIFPQVKKDCIDSFAIRTALRGRFHNFLSEKRAPPPHTYSRYSSLPCTAAQERRTRPPQHRQLPASHMLHRPMPLPSTHRRMTGQLWQMWTLRCRNGLPRRSLGPAILPDSLSKVSVVVTEAVKNDTRIKPLNIQNRAMTLPTSLLGTLSP